MADTEELMPAEVSDAGHAFLRIVRGHCDESGALAVLAGMAAAIAIRMYGPGVLEHVINSLSPSVLSGIQQRSEGNKSCLN